MKILLIILSSILLFALSKTNSLYSQEFNDSLPASKVLKSERFNMVHRDTIHKIEKIIYISKDTCAEEYLKDMHSILRKCPSSERVSIIYVRDKRIWKSINSDRYIESGNFKIGRRLYRRKLLPPYNRFPRFAYKEGEWEFDIQPSKRIVMKDSTNNKPIIDFLNTEKLCFSAFTGEEECLKLKGKTIYLDTLNADWIYNLKSKKNEFKSLDNNQNVYRQIDSLTFKNLYVDLSNNLKLKVEHDINQASLKMYFTPVFELDNEKYCIIYISEVYNMWIVKLKIRDNMVVASEVSQILD